MQVGKKSRFELLEHTGDLGLEIWSDSEAGIFETAATGLFSMICNLELVEPKFEERIALEAHSRDDLLVSWLSALNLKTIINQALFCKFTVDELQSNRLNATVWGENIVPEKHIIKREVKAITYHGLRFEWHRPDWYAQVIFDL